MTSGPRPHRGFDLTELRYRPIEHVIEALSLSELAVATGVSKSEWAAARCGLRRVSDEEAARIRRYLERSDP